MMSLIWMGGDPADFFPGFKGVAERKGYKLIHISELPAELNAAWFAAHVPEMAAAIVFASKDYLWVTQATRALRSTESGTLKFVPVVWLHGSANETQLTIAIEAGVSDFYCAENGMDELFSRVRLRRKDADHLIRLEAQKQESTIREAKSETIMKQREEFLSVCAHDLRSPLGIIQSGIGMVLQNAKNLPALQQELLVRAKRQSEHAVTLVNDLLDVMAFEQGFKPQFKMVSLHDYLNEFHRDYSIQATQKKITFHYDNPIKEWRVLIDPDRIRQLLQNLFTNAVKFTGEGKNIYLSVHPFKGRRKTDPQFPMIIVSLRDEGVGISKEDQQKIFERFSQVKETHRSEGRGLGLTVAKQISMLHDGNVWVESEEGKGSTFFVLFPHVISNPAVVPSEVKGKKTRLLIAEASETRRDKYFRILERSNCEIFFAKDGIEILTLFFHLLPDGIVLTRDQAKIDVKEVVRIIKKDPVGERIPVFYAMESGPLPEKGADFPFDELVKLPVTPDTFLKALSKLQRAQVKKAA